MPTQPSHPDDLAGALSASGAQSHSPHDETLLQDTTTHEIPEGQEPEVVLESGGPVTSRDDLLARLIIDRDLATTDEVVSCLKKSRSILGKRKSFDEWLLDRQTVTPNQLSRLVAQVEAERAGRTIPGFRMLATIGRGAVATVYKARQVNLDRLVAIKVLSPKSLRSERAVESFYAEARAAARLNHANIVQAFDVGRAGDVHFLVMEYVPGPTVHHAMEAGGPFTEVAALDIVIATADALAHAHEKGLVHRDVKPKNIILPREEGAAPIPKLADLGLARVIADRRAAMADKGRTLGTPFYISPEQVRGDVDIGPASDIYSLGASWYQMITGRPLFMGKDSKEVMNKHLLEQPKAPESINSTLHPGPCEVLMRMIAKDPAKRFPDCQTLLAELKAWRSVFTLREAETIKASTKTK